MTSLESDPFGYRAVKSGRVLIDRGGRVVTVLDGAKAGKLLGRLAEVTDERERQLLLARATGNYKRGNERRT